MALGRSRRGGGISVREMWEELREIKGWIEVVGGGELGSVLLLRFLKIWWMGCVSSQV